VLVLPCLVLSCRVLSDLVLALSSLVLSSSGTSLSGRHQQVVWSMFFEIPCLVRVRVRVRVRVKVRVSGELKNEKNTASDKLAQHNTPG
jgi:hypothetical protein